jgi:DNA modification methylase
MKAATAPSTPAAQALSEESQRVLSLLAIHTYEQVASMTGWSRGRIYSLALATGTRKTEARIRERADQRRQRQWETFQSMIDTTVKGDVLDFLDGIPDESVSLHVTSTPYNVGKRYGDGPAADRMRYVYFHGWLMQVISEMGRTLKPGGVVCLNVGKTIDWQDRLMPMDVMLFENLRAAGLTFQDRVVWESRHGLTPKRRLAGRHEMILVFSKGEPAVFNPTPARKPQKYPGKRAFKGPNRGELSGSPLGAHPTDVWDDIGQVRHNHPERKHGDHPAQFPVALPKRAILLYTNPGDVVCDPFCGSGSSAVAAIETGRHFIGADLFYEDLRAARIAAAQPDTVSPLPGVSDAGLAVWQAEARRVEHPARTEQPELFAVA